MTDDEYEEIFSGVQELALALLKLSIDFHVTVGSPDPTVRVI